MAIAISPKVRKHGWSKRRIWRKVHLAMDANTGQVRAALMTHQDVADGEVLPDLLAQIPADVPIETIGGDGAYDTKPCHAQIAARGATPSIPPREGAVPWPDNTPGAAWRNAAIDAIGKSSRREWKQASGYHRRSGCAEQLPQAPQLRPDGAAKLGPRRTRRPHQMRDIQRHVPGTPVEWNFQ